VRSEEYVLKTSKRRGIQKERIMKQSSEYHLTIIDDAGLVGRLKDELREVAHESELTWPEFKRDPKGFTGRMVRGYAAAGSKFLKGPNVVLAMTSAVFLVVAVILGIVLLDKWRAIREQQIAAKAQQVKEELVAWVKTLMSAASSRRSCSARKRAVFMEVCSPS